MFSLSKEEGRVSGKLNARLWIYPLWLLVVAGLSSLGFWQLDRAEQKKDWQLQQQATPLISPTASEINRALAEHRWIKAQLSVRWPKARPLFLDNRTDQGRAGYELFLPVQLEDGSYMAVNLGWLPSPVSRNQEPTVAIEGRSDVTSLSGVIGAPVDTFTLSAEGSGSDAAWRVQRQSVAQLAERWQLPLQPWMFWLDQPAIEGVKARVPGAGQMPPERHLGYAVQWFALALTLLILGGVLEWKITRKQHHD
ncbi:SURF1 family protein [Marinobacterium lutimaris]|uniref:SURF1 family protein n=1 Tax=Marinobacterium lutimaris TaxID=568106 RepID=UPI001356B4F4|nr:SURF1 family protein [Marinobacterium lutimaris]